VTVRRQAAEALPELARRAIEDLLAQLRHLDERIEAYDAQIQAQAKLSEPARRLMRIRGVGPTTALAIVATVGDARAFKNGRRSPPGSGSYRGSTPPPAARALGTSASVAMPIFETSSCKVRDQCCTRPLRTRIGARAGRSSSRSAAATSARSLPSPTRRTHRLGAARQG
jgi:hypothetical protein